MNKKRLKKLFIMVFLISFIGGVFGASFNNYVANNPQDVNLGRQFNSESLFSPEAVPDIVERSLPAVVSIIPKKDGSKPFIVGSGFIVGSNGVIITSAHVVDDSKAEYFVVTNDKENFPVEKIVSRPEKDIAILYINASGLPTLQLGDSDLIKQGQEVIAIGSVLGNLEDSVTTGVISATDRSITADGPNLKPQRLTGLIQTDVSLNPGNSGGPLLNLQGEAIGVNSAITEGAQNIGFAVPINTAKEVLSEE